MNIFFLDHCPKKAAQMQCDKHIIKMILESAQMLCTAHHELGTYTMLKDILYKKTHVNHPSSKWVRHRAHNYAWLYAHFVELCDEYSFRFNKRHLTDKKFRNKLIIVPKYIDHSWEITPPALAMPDEFKTNCPVESYRNYYKHKSKSIDMRWTNREKPEWMN